jgi:acetamidase/formamidase
MRQGRESRTPTLIPGRHGGNMDCPQIGAGADLYLPVQTEGALFGLGDAKALSGESEVAAAAIEVPVGVGLEFVLLKQCEVLAGSGVRCSRERICAHHDSVVPATSLNGCSLRAWYRRPQSLLGREGS